jgi:hypothetical protein
MLILKDNCSLLYLLYKPIADSQVSVTITNFYLRNEHIYVHILKNASNW